MLGLYVMLEFKTLSLNLTLMSLTLTLTLTLIIVAMNLIKTQQSAAAFHYQNCQLTSLGSVSCPMGRLGYVDSHESH